MYRWIGGRLAEGGRAARCGRHVHVHLRVHGRGHCTTQKRQREQTKKGERKRKREKDHPHRTARRTSTQIPTPHHRCTVAPPPSGFSRDHSRRGRAPRRGLDRDRRRPVINVQRPGSTVARRPGCGATAQCGAGRCGTCVYEQRSPRQIMPDDGMDLGTHVCFFVGFVCCDARCLVSKRLSGRCAGPCFSFG